MSIIRQVKVEGVRDDATVGVVTLTDNNNFKIALQELAAAISANSGSQLKVTLYSASGNAAGVNANNNFQAILNELSSTISSNSGEQLNTTIFDVSGNDVKVDGVTGSIQNIKSAHKSVHDGNHYYYTDSIVLGSATSQDYLITTPDTAVRGHLVLNIKGSLSTDVFVHEGADRTGTTLQTVFNNDRNSVNTPDITCHKGQSGGTTDGTQILSDYFGVSGGDLVVGRESELILDQNAKYIVRVTSNAASNRITTRFDWYEV